MPPTLDQPPQFPPDLQHENPPSVPNLIAQIDPWVIYHLKTTILSDVHYENQLYGVLNLFHASIFPLRRRFMTIPQGLLRKVLDPDNIDEYLADLSFGSTGGLHESRDLPGSEVQKFVPDFLTVKVTPQRAGPRDHCIVAIVEVKRNDDVSESRALTQALNYLERAWQQPSHDAELRGYLVMGRMVHPIRMDDAGWAVSDPPFNMFAAGDRLTRELCESALRNWN